MTDNKYNGWTNYATWRVNLELFDGYGEDLDKDTDPSDLAEQLKEMAEEAITGYGEINPQSLAVSYATAFINDVNYYEIAESIIEAWKE